jgi:signal transduction histidine kinase
LTDISANQLSAILDQAPLAMALTEVDANGNCIFRLTNAAFRDFFHLRGELVSEQSCASLFGEADARALGALLRSEVEKMSLQFDTTVKVAPDRSITCKVTARRVSGAEPKRAMITVELATPFGSNGDPDRGVDQGMQQREDFIATLTHDLKTPIVGANMVLTALLDGTVGELQPAQAEIIGKLRTSNQALLKMIQNLLEVYKYESGTESLRFDGANLADIVKFCADDVRPLTDSKRIVLDIFCSKPELLLICDEYAIKRVLINLLSNAVKFTPEGGHISVRAFEDSNLARVMVQDTGRGINADDRQKLFQRFWQGEPGRRYSAGTGLGLYFCYNVVKAHGGKIVCDSEPGQGTTFTIDLPKHVYAQ